MNIRHFLKKKHETGQGLVEYALILVLVAVVVIVVLTQLGPVIGNTFSSIMDSFEQGSGECIVMHSDFGSEVVPDSVLNGADAGPWHWPGANLRHQPTGRVVYNVGWVSGVSASGDCSPLS